MTSRVLHDALGRAVTVSPSPQRIVSLVPSLAEWLFALGLGPRVVGVTDFCVQPDTGEWAALLKTKPRLRGTKNSDRAAIIALQPDLIIANKEENRERDVLALAEADLAVYVTDPRSVRDAILMLKELAWMIGAAPVAQPYLQAVRDTYQKLTTWQSRLSRVLVPI